MPTGQDRIASLAVLLALAAGFSPPFCAAQEARANLTASQIVEHVRLNTKSQNDDLKHYKALRHYQVEYRGFSTKVDAEMDVEVSYDTGAGKNFRIVSESGSKTLREKVLRRALESEEEAAQDKASTALSEANYRFQLLSSENLEGRQAYVLNVEPLTASKFLYRGKIWVDAVDFAVVKMETEPAKSPSFWIARTLIHYTGAKTGSFWLPQQVRSETHVRVGGTAVMTIDYGSYDVIPETATQAAVSR
ncbi:MAG: hypothetical protein ABSF53_07555 [Terracidiphilus sp.]|jgi:hypothetical protein